MPKRTPPEARMLEASLPAAPAASGTPSPDGPTLEASEITRVFDEGYAVVLVSADRRERVITAKTLAASA